MPDARPDFVRRAVGAAPWILVLAVGLAFSGSLDNAFVAWDDDTYIVETAAARHLDLRSAWEEVRSVYPHFQPVARLAHILDLGIFGLWSGGHHLTSLFLHLANALLVGILLRRILDRANAPGSEAARHLAALLAALLWAVHPLRVEAVAWASQKKELLATGFALLSALSYLEGASRGARVRTFAWFALALLSKPSVVTLPCVLLMLDLWPFGRLIRGAPRARRRIAATLAALLILGAVVALLTWLGARRRGPRDVPMAREPTARLLLPTRSVLFSLHATLLPVVRSPLQPMPSERTVANPAFGISVLVTGWLACGLYLATRRGYRAVPTAMGSFALLLAPTAGLVPLAGIEAADRFTYLPTLPLHALAAAGLAFAVARRPRLTTAAVGVAALFLVRQTRIQTEVWADSTAFWMSVIRNHPAATPSAYRNLALLDIREHAQRPDPRALRRAEELLRRGHALFPRHARTAFDLGMLLASQGRVREALPVLEDACRLAPEEQGPCVALGRLRLNPNLKVRLADQ